MPFDPNMYGNVAGLNIDWATAQGQGTFLKLEDKVPTPLCIVRALADGKFCTDHVKVHHWNDPATGKYNRIPCGRSAGQACLLCDKLDELIRERKLDTVAEKVQKFLKGQDRHSTRVIQMSPYVAKARSVVQARLAGNMPLAHQLQAELYEAMSKAAPIGWDFPKQVFEAIWTLIQGSRVRYQGQLVDPTNPAQACVLWVTRVPNASGFKEFKMDIEFDLRVPIPIEIVRVAPTYDQLWQEEVSRIAHWPPEVIGKLLGFQGMGPAPTALPPGAGPVIQGQYSLGQPPQYQASPGTITDFAVQQPPQQPAYQPAYQPAPQYAPQGPGAPYAPPAQQYPGPQAAPNPAQYAQPGATVSASELPCLGHFNAGDPKCAHCGQMQGCLQAVRSNAGQATAPAYAPAMTPPTQPQYQQPPAAAAQQPPTPGQLAPAAQRAMEIVERSRAAAREASASLDPATKPVA